jgi:hypothetical protein
MSELESLAFSFANDPSLPEAVKEFIRKLWASHCALEQKIEVLQAELLEETLAADEWREKAGG